MFVLCLKPYPEDPAVYKPLSQEELQRIKNEKKQKQNERNVILITNKSTLFLEKKGKRLSKSKKIFSKINFKSNEMNK